MSTCNGGCECLSCVYGSRCIITFAAFTVNALEPGYSYVGPAGGIDDSNMCKCNTISYSLISACDACQGSDWIRFDFHAYLPSNPFMYLLLAGPIIRPTAQQLCLPQREILGPREFCVVIYIDDVNGPKVPKPCACGNAHTQVGSP